MLAGLLEEVAHAGRADADDHLHELRGAHGEEGHVRLARHGAREERLAGSGRADEEHSFGSSAAEAGVLRRVTEEVDDLDQLVLGLVDAGDVVESDLLVGGLIVAARFALADAHQAGHAAALLRRPAEHPHVEADEEQRGPESVDQRRDGAALFLDGSGADLDVVIDEELLETRIDESGKRGCEPFRRPGRFARGCQVGRDLLARSGIRDVVPEPSRERVAAAVDGGDVLLLHFLLEERVGHGDRLLAAGLQHAEEDEVRD